MSNSARESCTKRLFDSGAPDVEAQVRSHARFDQICDALAASSNKGISGGGGSPADGGSVTAMPGVELAGPGSSQGQAGVTPSTLLTLTYTYTLHLDLDLPDLDIAYTA